MPKKKKTVKKAAYAIYAGSPSIIAVALATYLMGIIVHPRPTIQAEKILHTVIIDTLNRYAGS